MCAIIDANTDDEMFGKNPPQAGERFLDWIESGKGGLVTGGKNKSELEQTSGRNWIRQAILAGQVRNVNSSKIDSVSLRPKEGSLCNSNDHHVIALAQVSGARLLYSNDKDLHRDFRNSGLVSQPRGKVYSTLKQREFGRNHRSLLMRKDLCLTDQ